MQKYVDSIPESGRSPEVEIVTHSSILAMDRRIRRATVHGAGNSRTWLSDWAHTTFIYIGKPKNSCDSLYHNIHCIAVFRNQTQIHFHWFNQYSEYFLKINASQFVVCSVINLNSFLFVYCFVQFCHCVLGREFAQLLTQPSQNMKKYFHKISKGKMEK